MTQFIRFLDPDNFSKTINLDRVIDIVSEKRNETSFSYDMGEQLFDMNEDPIAPCDTISADYSYVCQQIQNALPTDRFIQVDCRYEEFGRQDGKDLYREKYVHVWNQGYYDKLELRMILSVGEHEKGHVELKIIRDEVYTITDMEYSIYITFLSMLERLRNEGNFKGIVIDDRGINLVPLDHKDKPEKMLERILAYGRDEDK